ncbi:Phosphatidylinositol N-acetylglucosaminyltransferase GPI2 subunit [Penicillium ucsense]|uniref:Phosphatidylinositol N-acetylglucosaminyltransferase GPI2 subunit n=1 Tax=Penicillium ucsense TaxID=2839758 RepID=A0A8J8W6R6_9EURO|nr:Phosphatidylinositol N-acetylglucosaminyltransferase GPI2 subunit [Penicillium ucsense]KAF7737188.1 Phosphatidylinositol N-acetylglucosaminyltransferase GPI2 subunit [Penicillium ucsense]
MISPTSPTSPVPPPVPVDTHPNRASDTNPPGPDRIPDPDRLAPEDAYFAHSLSRVRSVPLNYEDGLRSLRAADSGVATLLPPRSNLNDVTRKDVRKIGPAGSRRRRKGVWKKLLWVKQSYPDNYTDTETFLDHLQRNPRVRPYDFWPLVADSTVIVQHVCSVVIFICCFVGIVQDRVSPVSIVCWGSVGTAIGWILWDNWIWEEQTELARNLVGVKGGDDESSSSSVTSAPHPSGHDPQSTGLKADTIHGLGLSMSPSAHHKEDVSHLTSDEPGAFYGIADPASHSAASFLSPSTRVPHADVPVIERASLFSSRNRQRLSTVKSAFLIYFSLLGLSPILKSLTKSTASDSIWALSCWLLIMNIFSFDYGSGEGAGDTTKFPASLSTNAAVMASTVLASRLPSTTHVFSLMLFSMEVFGLFPIFRRQLRQKSWTGHVLLTLALVMIAGGAVGTTLGGGWGSAVIGSFLGSLLTAFAMGGCSWWLISLQKYKNVVIGPWDPARPIIRRHWN